MNKFYFANEGIDWDTRYKNKWVIINQVKLREPLEIQTIQLKKYLKWTSAFEYNGHKLPILITLKVIRHTLTYWKITLPMIIPIHITYSLTYPSIETADMHHYWQWQWQYCWGEVVTLLIKLYVDLRNNTLLWSAAFIANARLELVYQSINQSNKQTINQSLNFISPKRDMSSKNTKYNS